MLTVGTYTSVFLLSTDFAKFEAQYMPTQVIRSTVNYLRLHYCLQLHTDKIPMALTTVIHGTIRFPRSCKTLAGLR